MTTTEVGPADHPMLLRSKRAECSAIVTSRKRKLRELFAIATEVDGIPNHDFSDPDAPPTTPAEAQFLLECDILRGRKLSELYIPARPKLGADTLHRFLDSVRPVSGENAPFAPSKPELENGVETEPATPGLQEAVDGSSASGQADIDQAPPPPVSESAKPDAGQSETGRRLVEQVGLPEPEGRSNGPTVLPIDVSVADTPERNAKEYTADIKNLTQKDRAARAVPTPPSVPETRQVLDATDASVKASGEEMDAFAEPMDIDGAPKGVRDDSNHLTIRPPTGDSTKVHDALSSPGSTPAQSATTPAIHDASADTSPENEGSQYVGPGEEKTEQPRPPETEHAAEPVGAGGGFANHLSQEDDQGASDAAGGAVNGVEAQLLQESAAARLAKIDENPEGSSALEAPTVSQVHPPITGSSAGLTSPQEGQVLANEAPLKASVASQAPAEMASAGQEPTPADSMDLDGPVAAQAPLSQMTTTEAPQGSSGAALQLSPQAPPSPEHVNSASSPPTVERAVTRISSGALRQKSVSELLGESPRATSAGVDAPVGAGLEHEDAAPTPPLKSLANKSRDARRRSVPTVVFGKQPKQAKKSNDTSLVARREKSGQLPTDDYFTPLFIDGFTRQTKWMKPIEQLIHQAHKALSTSDQYLSILDQQACRILRRVYHLQQHDKWSLRQPMRCPEPTRPPSHLDTLIQEMKWMRTDFREERKWKRAVARNLAVACAEWVSARPEERKLLQVNAFIPPKASTDATMADPEDAIIGPVHNDLLVGEDGEPVEASPLLETVSPSAIFALQDNEVVFGLTRSEASDRLLDELPLYGSPLKVPKFDPTGPEYDPDATWKRPALPLSKYVEGQMVLTSSEPPRKRSRYRYAEEDEDEDGEEVFDAQPDKRSSLPARSTDVALFNPEMKPIRDRLHAGHQFRPPSEYSMPLQSFYECRSASQWTWGEDDELKSLVRTYSYNWSLISSMISTRSTYHSGAERRSPWECFERWINLEGLPNDMSKTQYFKTYQNRIDAAQRVIKQQNESQQQQVGPNGAVMPAIRRRPTTTMRVDRRRNQKHLALIDAMRKLAKKREATAAKAQHVASIAAGRKSNEAQRQPVATKTPRDYSIMRWERDQQLAEKMAQYAQRQQEALQRRTQQARSQGQAGHMIPASGPAQLQQNAGQVSTPNPAAAAARLNVAGGQPGAPGQARSRIPMQAPQNSMAAVQAQIGGGLVPPLPMNGVPQAQLHAMQAQHRVPMNNPQADLNLVLQAKRIQDQQRAAVQMQQQAQHQQQNLQSQQAQQHQQQQVQQHQQHGQPMQQQSSTGGQGSPTGMRNMVNGVNQQAFMANAQAMMASLNATNGGGMATSPGAPGAGLNMHHMLNGSPRSAIPPAQLSALNAQLRELENSYREKYPNCTQDQIRQQATEHLGRLYVQQRQQHLSQSAMNAAAGAITQQALANGMTATTSPHQYAQLLRAQQQAQAAQAAAQQAGQHQRQSSGSATPGPRKTNGE